MTEADLRAQVESARSSARAEASSAQIHYEARLRLESENASLAAQLGEAREALLEIRDKWVPALRRDAREPDKTMCHAGGIAHLLALIVPTHSNPPSTAPSALARVKAQAMVEAYRDVAMNAVKACGYCSGAKLYGCACGHVAQWAEARALAQEKP